MMPLGHTPTTERYSVNSKLLILLVPTWKNCSVWTRRRRVWKVDGSLGREIGSVWTLELGESREWEVRWWISFSF